MSIILEISTITTNNYYNILYYKNIDPPLEIEVNTQKINIENLPSYSNSNFVIEKDGNYLRFKSKSLNNIVNNFSIKLIWGHSSIKETISPMMSDEPISNNIQDF